MRIDNAIINQAKQTDLVSYLSLRGEPLIRKGSEYQHGDHDSLFIKGNVFRWYSKIGKGGKCFSGAAIDFVMEFYGMTFIQAVAELTGVNNGQVTPYVPVANKPKVLVMPNKADNVRRVFAYLVQTRRIDKKVLQLCFDRHLIYQDTFGNVVFRMKDINGHIVGAEIRGTGSVRYTGIASGSLYGYGFNLSIGTNCERMIVLESSIDLLSFISLHYKNLGGRVLLSMAGLKEQTLLNMANLYNIDLKNVCCATDNDEAGINFANKMQLEYGTKTFLPNSAKDWNEVLLLEKIN
ncbi:DUF3991 domain-containing protein [Pelosinus sp. sgz500959]|uniref:DUF3991 domain-containing protein n=1 Tax=Pelosinus sp. sgz500959 TaxID=3242472 RepID=UPI0036729319